MKRVIDRIFGNLVRDRVKFRKIFSYSVLLLAVKLTWNRALNVNKVSKRFLMYAANRVYLKLISPLKDHSI